MTAKKGNGLLMVYSDVAAEHDEEYNRLYNEEHIPERLSIPGVLNAARYEAVEGVPDTWPATSLSRSTPGIPKHGKNGSRSRLNGPSGCLPV